MNPRNSKYLVKKGDSLWKIAHIQYGDPTAWPAIAKANRLPSNGAILVGMNLRLPIIPVHPQLHAHATKSPHLVNASFPPGPLQPFAPLPKTPSPFQSSSPAAVATAPALTQTVVDTPTAREVNAPGIKYSFDALPPITIENPLVEIKLTLKGEVSLQKEGTLTAVAMSQDGHLAASLKREYDSNFAKIATDSQVEYDPGAKKVTLSAGYAVTSKVNGEEFSTTQFRLQPPSTVVFSLQPRPIKGTKNGYSFEGTLGYEIEVTPRNGAPPATKPIQVTVPTTSVWVKIAAGGAILLAIGIVVVDALKDVGTLGAGTVETPLSWAAAATLFRGALAAF